MESIKLYPLFCIKSIKEGDSLAELIIENIKKSELTIENNDIIVVAHKIVSKAEGRVIDLLNIVPSKRALRISEITGKNPALIELILQESTELLKVTKRGIIISKHKLGFICANAGIDRSNTGKNNFAVLLPLKPDNSAYIIRSKIEKYFKKKIAVIINDTHGRSFREGAVGIAIGCSGINPLKSYIGKKDRDGYVMMSSVEAIIDEVSSAATLLMGQSDEGIPVVLIKGVKFEYCDKGIKNIIRDTKKELFR